MMSPRSVMFALLLLPLTAPLAAQSGAAMPKTASLAAAESLYAAHDWAAAQRGYAAVLRADSTNGLAWLRLGATLHEQARYADAIAAYQRALRLKFQTISAQYRLARAYAALGDPERALSFLDQAIQAGYRNPRHFRAEADFAKLQSNPKFQAMIADVERRRYPCHGGESAQLDFWIGKWDVLAWGPDSPNANQPPGYNEIYPLLEHCVVLENWRGAGGGEGKSVNFFDPNLKKWRQIWRADDGSVLDYVGEFRDGAMRLEGWTPDSAGKKVLQRLTLTPIAADTVRQLIESSEDGGKTWTSWFDGRYVRRAQ